MEAVLEGKEEQLKEIINFCKECLPGAVIKKIETEWKSYTGEFDKFIIRY